MGNLTVKESGEMINFISPNVSKITSFKVHFSPKQEGSGDPSPENVREITGWNGVEGYGCGKNLVPWIKTNFTVQGNYYNSFAGWSKLWEIPKRISYTYSVFIDNSNCNTAGGARVWLRDIDNSKYTHIVTGTEIKAGEKGISTVTLNFSNLPNDYYACWGLNLYPNAIASMPIVYESDQETIIPIDFTNNYLNKIQITNNKTINSTGEEMTESGMSVTDYISVNENEKWLLYFVSTTGGRTRRIWGYDENKQPISEFAKVSWATVDQEYTLTANITSDVKYIKVCYYTNDTDLLLTIDGTSFKNVYGGYIDLVNGELVEEWHSITFDGENVKVNLDYSLASGDTDYIKAYWVYFSPIGISDTHCKCNTLKITYSHNKSRIPQTPCLFLSRNGNTFGGLILGKKEDYPELAEGTKQDRIDAINNWFKENPTQVVYKLKTPIIHQLTPQQLSTLKGQNNFWSNADYVEIEYELTETFDIQKAKRKIILNQPHVESASGDIITFDTDIKSRLKECKVYFSPVQEGEGDPSPDNVREITGWNGIEGYISNVAQSYGSTSNTLTATIDWTNDVGTVYGGYVDLVSGELVVNRCFLENENWTEYKRNNGFVAYRLSTMPTSKGANQICKPISNIISNFKNFSSNNMTENVMQINGTSLYVALAEEIDTSEIQLSYELADPIHYQLTPQQLTALRGTNAIYFNTNGQIDIKYWIYFPKINYMKDAEWLDHSYITSAGKLIEESTALSHTTVNSILLPAGNYRIYGFCYQKPPASSLNCRVHEYNTNGNWIKLITSNAANTMSLYILEFSLDHDSYIKLSLPRMLECKLIKLY